MHRGLRAVFFIVLLDAAGIGVVFPTLPKLLESMLHSGDAAQHYGYLLAAYAATLFLASPVLGSLSDRFGRRPVLLLSLFGTAADDLVMALAHTLPVLYLGRTLAGLTGANMTVANAYLADVTTPDDRAKAFGRMNASFGIGFVAGPLMGGLLGAYSPRAPFLLAAALNLLGACVCYFVLPESYRPAKPLPFAAAALNPFASLRSLRSLHGAGPFLYIFTTMSMVGQVPSVLWVLYGTARFGWSPAAVGLSFAVFGVLHALCQGFLPEVAQRRLGQRRTVIAGIAVDALGYSVFSLTRTSPAAFATMPLMAVGGVGEPAVQSMLTGSVSETRQGELQGVLTSLVSLTAIVGPVIVSGLYQWSRAHVPGYPGAIWLSTVMLYLPCIPILFAGRRISRATSTD